MDKVQVGQAWRPPTAAQQNAWSKSSEHYQRRLELSEGGAPERAPISTDLVKIRNDTGYNLARGSVVRIGRRILSDAAFDPDHLWMSAHEPLAVFGDEYVHGIIRRPAPIGEIVECQLSGVVLAVVYVSNIHHRFATWGNGFGLWSVDAGRAAAEIVEKPLETGLQQLVVRLPGPREPQPDVQFYLPETVVVTETYPTDWKRIPFDCHLNTAKDIYDTTGCAGGATSRDLTFKAAGLYKIAVNCVGSIGTGTTWYSYPVIWAAYSLGGPWAGCPKSAMIQTVARFCEVGEFFTMERTFDFNCVANTELQINAGRYESDSDTFSLVGGDAAELFGCAYSIKRTGPYIGASQYTRPLHHRA